MFVTWSVDNGGSEILSYTILIRTSDNLSFITEQTNCNGSNQLVVATSSCVIPASVLNAPQFSLPWGSSVYVKVIAANVYGSSVESLPGNGATIITLPDAPISLTENTQVRDITTLGITWSNGVSDGGLAVLDYRLSMTLSGGSYTVVASGIIAQSYTVTGLETGSIYNFIVESRNAYKYSTPSEPI